MLRWFGVGLVVLGIALLIGGRKRPAEQEPSEPLPQRLRDRGAL